MLAQRLDFFSRRQRPPVRTPHAVGSVLGVVGPAGYDAGSEWPIGSNQAASRLFWRSWLLVASM